MKAVVFDFFGTLSINASRTERRTNAGRVAEALGVPADLYFEHLGATFTQRATGASGDLEATIRWLAELCECAPDDDQVAAACALPRATEEVAVRSLRADAVPTLAALKQRGIKIGLVSDCTHELPEIWPTLPVAEYVDATVFSTLIRRRKPHPEMYATVTSQLGVAPADCLYVGDGGSGELTGATQAGMTAYQLVAPDGADAIIYDADVWSGASITTLSDVLPLVDQR